LVLNGACLELENVVSRRIGLVWPSPGTEWDEVNRAVTVGEVTAHVGDDVLLGGGELVVTVDSLDSGNWVNPPAEECLGVPYWKVGGLRLPEGGG
jgi:hypothetical protein